MLGLLYTGGSAYGSRTQAPTEYMVNTPTSTATHEFPATSTSTQTDTDSTDTDKESKPFYKKPAFWLLAVGGAATVGIVFKLVRR